MSSDSDSDSEKATYCGLKKPTKNKKWASQEYCLEHKQVRRYGAIKIDQDVLNGNSVKKLDLVTEQLRYRSLIDKRNIMLKKFRNAKVIFDNVDERPAKRDAAKKEIDALRKRNITIRAQMEKQLKVVQDLEKAKDIAKKEAEKKKTAKSKKKDSTKSKKKDSTKSKKKSSTKSKKKRGSPRKSGSKTLSRPKKKIIKKSRK